jgi:glycosyltransferase involved in cell wall biosynthesis
MKILMTADTVGGVWTYAIDLARALAPHGAQVTLATMGAPVRPDQRREAEEIPGLALCESEYRLEWMDDPWDDVDAAGRWLLALEREVAPDIVHLNGYVHGCLPFQAPVLIVAHSCVCSWWRAVHGEEAPAFWNCYRSRVAAGLRGAGRVVAPTQAMLDAVHSHYGIAGGEVVPNGRDPKPYAPGRARAKEPFILTAGRLWDEAKNVRALTEIAGDLPVPVCVAGDCGGPDGGRIDLPNVRALGRLAPPVLAGWMLRAALYALPARYEPFGLSALEAALSGCALVLGDIASLREVWGDAALFVPPDDREALRDALTGLIENPGRRADLAVCAAARASRYTLDRMAAGYLKVYRELAGCCTPDWKSGASNQDCPPSRAQFGLRKRCVHAGGQSLS